jgi:Flp pilus assembly protein TadG
MLSRDAWRSRAGEGESEDEGGMVLVWMALLLFLLLGCAAIAIDVTFWQLEHNREQRAADAAALAGAVSFPQNPTTSNAAAQSVAGTNGYTVSTVTAFDLDGGCSLTSAQTIRMCVGTGSQPFEYKVKIEHRVNNIFGGIFGITSSTIGATASATYLKPLSMGSPSNQFGNDPDAIRSWPVSNPPPQTYPNFWANIAGGSSTKQNGDAYAADQCVAGTDGCSGVGIGNNLDYNPKGYFYTVDFTANSTVNLQAFDPAFVQVGDTCTDTTPNLATAKTLTRVPFYPEGTTNTADIARRYAPVTNASNQSDPGFQYCTGDMLFGSGPAPATTYTVWKATVPGDPASAMQVCAPITYPGFSGSVVNDLQNGITPAGAPSPLAAYFRQWVTLCTVSGNAGDEYFIQVSTDTGSQGHNRFSLRGVTSSGSAAPVDIAGNAYMGIYANVGSQLTQFDLVRIPNAAAGHTLQLNFFDIGDAAAGSVGTLTVVPPSDSNVGSTFNGCQSTTSPGTGALGFASNTPTAPWGTLTPLANCAIQNVNNGGTWNGQWITVTIPIPANYTCDESDPNGCWTKINYQFTGGISDTTSWNAALLGDPVHLTT